MSFETWFQYSLPFGVAVTGSNGYSYVFDMCGELGQGHDNLGLTTLAYSQSMFYLIFPTGQTASQHLTVTSLVASPGNWQHGVLTIDQYDPADFGLNRANCAIYLNGARILTQNCDVPAWTIRSNNYL